MRSHLSRPPGSHPRQASVPAAQTPKNEFSARLAAVPADLPYIHPNIADIYRSKVERLAEALDHPEDRTRRHPP